MNAHVPPPDTVDAIEDEPAPSMSSGDDAVVQRIIEHKRTMEDILWEQAQRNVLRPAPRKSERFSRGDA